VKVRLVVSILLVAMAALARTAVADAGTYTVHACKAPGGEHAAIPWVVEQRYPSGYSTGNACPGGYFWMDLVATVQHPADEYARATFRAPADTEITAYTLRRSLQLTNPYRYDFHEIRTDGSFLVRETCFGDLGCGGLGDYHNANASSNVLTASGRAGVTGLSFVLFCRNGVSGPVCPMGAPSDNFQLHRAEVTLTDATSPTLMLPPTGPLVNGSTPLAGTQQVFIWAGDRGGGVRDVLFEVDGKVVDGATLDDNDGRCEEPFDTAQPCKLDARGTVGLDTTKLSDGKHQLRLLVTDATDTNMAAWGPITIETANGTCDVEPRSAALNLHAIFAANPRVRARSLRYTQRPRVRGQVTRADGTPAAGVPVCVADRVALPDAPVRRVASLTTDAQGRFQYTLPRGPSRRVYFVTRIGDGAVSDSVRVRVRAAANLRASRRSLRNGQLLTLSGKLSGGGIPRLGVLVDVQVFKPLKGWQNFGSGMRTTRSGRYQYRYRFTSTTETVRYRFRARVREQGIYPFTTGASRTVSVIVRG
jgi:hypothetical protein